MCVTIFSTAHPEYPFILLNNRDEFLNRPTAHAHWWEDPNQHVLGGRDLQRQARGTWLAITKQGRLANLTNFRDEDSEVAGNKSRGGLITAYVNVPPGATESDDAFAKRLVDEIGIQDVGGFTLLFGQLRASKDGALPGLGVVSNRTASAEGVKRIGTLLGETHGLSNSHYGDMSWPKVVHGEQLLKQAIHANVIRNEGQDKLVESLFDILSVDTLPRPKPGEAFQTYTRQLRNSIIVPPVGGEGVESKHGDQLAAAKGTDTPDHGSVKVGEGVYGTQKQTIILVSREGKVTLVERTLYDGQAKPTEIEDRDRKFEFTIDGWDK